MSWTIQFEIKDGKVDPDSIKHYGNTTDADGRVTISGHSDERMMSVGCTVSGQSVNATMGKSGVADSDVNPESTG